MSGQRIPSSLLAETPDPAAAPEAAPAEAAVPRAGAVAGRLQRPRIGGLTRLKAYGESHLQALFNTLGRMSRTPVASLLTIAVIGIALALPTGLHLLLQNMQSVSAGWEDAAQISLFLRKDVTDAASQRLADDIRAKEAVSSVTVISPAQALDEFRRQSGFGEALDALGDNPLPAVLVVRPRAETGTPARVEALLKRLRDRPEVETAQLDLEWVKRLYALMEIGKRGVLVLGILLAVAVLLIVGNTIRLGIQNRREEIVVQKLIGATDAFVRRPFIYSGLLLGLFGALFAWLVVSLSLWLLDEPVRRLALLYDSGFELGGLGAAASVALLLGGVALGTAGAWLAVGRHIREIEPQ
jgi:cell division transport system permease protein